MSFLIHATDADGLRGILASQKILAIPPKHRMKVNGRHIFLQWLHPSTLPRRHKATFWGPILLVFSDAMLRGHSGTYGPIGSFDQPSKAHKFQGVLNDAQKRAIAALCSYERSDMPPSLWFMHSHEITVKEDVTLENLVAIVTFVPHVLVPSPSHIPILHASNKTFLQLYHVLVRSTVV